MQMFLLTRRALMKGFIVSDYKEKFVADKLNPSDIKAENIFQNGVKLKIKMSTVR